MFTGLIEEIGIVRGIRKQGQAMALTIQASKVLENVALGDSIAVNGVCLTVVQFSGDAFTVDVMPETYRKTNLAKLTVGQRVNLERAMAADGRFGGHIVQGHVDGVGVVASRVKESNAVVFTIKPNEDKLFQYMIPRGSVALDGVSLTLVKADGNELAVSIIPHTLAETVLNDKHPGDTVNIECDLLGKYVKHLLQFNYGEQAQGLNVDKLREYGFA